MEALLSIIASVFPATVAGLSMTQWLAIANAVMAAEPEIKAALAALHPALSQIVSDLGQGSTPEEAADSRFRGTPSEMGGVR